LLYTNAQSLAGKVDELSATACELQPDIIALTETWCNSDISNSVLTIDGYELVPDLRMDRSDTAGGRGGGLIVYTRSGKKVLKLDKQLLFSQLCSFMMDDVTFNLVYRPPSAAAESVAELASLVSEAKKNEVFIGDFNLPGIDWATSGGGRGRNAVLVEAVENALMSQLVDFPTHTKGIILDLVLTNIPERVEEIYEAVRLGKSDHIMMALKISVEGGKDEKPPQGKDWRKADWEAMKTELANRDWLYRLRRADAAAVWNILRDKITDLVQRFVPERRMRNQNRPAWLTQNILREIRKKKRLWKTVRGGIITDEYKQTEKNVKNMIRSSKRRFEKKLADNKGSNRQFFAYVKKKTGTRSSVGPLKTAGGETVADAQGMAEILNRSFKEVFTRENTASVPELDARENGSILTNVQFTVRAIKKKIHELKPESVPGLDGIAPQLLKELTDEISPALASIFTKSLEEGVIPADWKEANVTPIFKKGAKSAPGNYRPVSLTSVACKLMESIIRDEMTNHLEANNLINKSQHGFMKGRSCATNLLEFLEKATTVVDGGGSFDIIYLDFAKAFDKVPTQRLIRKVRAHGIRGPLLTWIESWLSGRRQRVVLNGKFSSWEEVLSGVPQGSVLGPLLFIIFINDLDDSAAAVDILRKFADDTKLGHEVTNPKSCSELQASLDGLVKWAETWGMQFNVSKCKTMHLGRRNSKNVYTMAGEALKETEVEKDIGVYVNQKLKPAEQCKSAARMAQAVLGQITRAFHYRDRHVFVRLYKQYVRPHLEFCTQAWSPWSEEDITCLEKVQQRAIKMVSGLRARTYEERLKELGLSTLVERRHQADMVMVHRIVHRQSSLEPETWFEMVGARRSTRSASDPLNIVVKNGLLDLRRKFFAVRVIENWNAIPTELKAVESTARFRSRYKQLRAQTLSAS
jgi:hypothetical protein